MISAFLPRSLPSFQELYVHICTDTHAHVCVCMCAWKSKVDGTGVGIMILRWSSADLEMHQFGEAVWPMCSKDLQTVSLCSPNWSGTQCYLSSCIGLPCPLASFSSMLWWKSMWQTLFTLRQKQRGTGTKGPHSISLAVKNLLCRPGWTHSLCLCLLSAGFKGICHHCPENSISS